MFRRVRGKYLLTCVFLNFLIKKMAKDFVLQVFGESWGTAQGFWQFSLFKIWHYLINGSYTLP